MDTDGTVWAGITWHPDLAEVDLHIDDPSQFDYSDIDMTLSSKDDGIAAVGQLDNNVPCRTIPGDVKVYSMTVSGTDADGRPLTIRADHNSDFLVGVGQERRITCDKIPHGSTAIIILAYVRLTAVFPRLLRVPENITIEGSYRAANREIKIKKQTLHWAPPQYPK